MTATSTVRILGFWQNRNKESHFSREMNKSAWIEKSTKEQTWMHKNSYVHKNLHTFFCHCFNFMHFLGEVYVWYGTCVDISASVVVRTCRRWFSSSTCGPREEARTIGSGSRCHLLSHISPPFCKASVYFVWGWRWYLQASCCTHECQRTPWESVLSFHHLGLGNRTQVMRLGIGAFTHLSRLSCTLNYVLNVFFSSGKTVKGIETS